jgi:hypothetical protein
MVREARERSFVEGEAARGMREVLVSVKVEQLGPVRQGGSQGLWQHGSRVGMVTVVVPSVGSRVGVVVGDKISPLFEGAALVDKFDAHSRSRLAGWGGEREE